MGRWHTHACRRAGGRVVAVVDVDRDAADRLAQRYAVGAAVAESLESLPSTAIDVVHVCTPVSSHASLIHAAIARRLPVIVEKPLAADAPSTEQLLRDAAGAGVWVVPVHQTLFQAGVQRAVRWAHGQTLYAFDYRACSAGATTTALRGHRRGGDPAASPLVAGDVLLAWRNF